MFSIRVDSLWRGAYFLAARGTPGTKSDFVPLEIYEQMFYIGVDASPLHGRPAYMLWYGVAGSEC